MTRSVCRYLQTSLKVNRDNEKLINSIRSDQSSLHDHDHETGIIIPEKVTKNNHNNNNNNNNNSNNNNNNNSNNNNNNNNIFERL